MSVHSGIPASRKSRLAIFAGLFIAILLGAFLRTIWGDDIEYKDDERFTFEHSQAIGASDPWPWTGMPMSLGPPNPGLSVWVFSGLARSVIHNSDYATVEDCRAAIDRYFAERNAYFLANPKQAGKVIWGKELVKPEFNELNHCDKRK